MLAFRSSEGVSAGTVRHEIEIGRSFRIQHRQNSILAGIADRRRRQACNRVGVVRGWAQKLARENAVAEWIALVDSINHRRIRFQFHAETKPVDENGSDVAPLLGNCRFLFDERGQSNGLLWCSKGK